MRTLVVLGTIALAFAARPLTAQEIVSQAGAPAQSSGSERYVPTQIAPIPEGIAAFGPFRVLGRTRAALVGVTDENSPNAFAAMVSVFPQIALLEMVECPGTLDDRANLRLGRMIREHGIATYVPDGGSVRSGGVELFLAGTRRIAAPHAEFAVHSWKDDSGREADDYAPAAPENAKYLAYYRQMGMSEAQAVRFYAMTNSVPFGEARWLNTAQMASWVTLDEMGG